MSSPTKSKTPSFSDFSPGRRKPMTVSSEDMISTELLDPERGFVVAIRPNVDDFTLETWLDDNRELVLDKLSAHGAVLLKGCRVPKERFRDLAYKVTPDLLEYRERAAPRKEVGSKVFTSTEFPADQVIPLHHEMSYSHNWPAKLWFYCAEPADEGGCTPLSNDLVVIDRLEPDVKEPFIEKSIMYVRNYGEGADLPWQEAFQTDDRAEVEEYCRKSRMECEWRGGERLRTRAVRQVLETHPVTGDTVWFNHAHMFHVSNLENSVREALLQEFDQDELPRNAFYGDGTPIEFEALEHIRSTYEEAAHRFTWEQGDLLLVDNILTSHGRDTFSGSREILVAMAELLSSELPD